MSNGATKSTTLAIILWSAVFVFRPVGASSGCFSPWQPARSVIQPTAAPDAYGRYPIDTKINYGCEPGYELVKYEMRACQQNGSWTGLEPICAKNVALDATMINLKGGIYNPDNIVDGFYNSCSPFNIPTQENINWRIILADSVELSAVKVAFMITKDSRNVEYSIFSKNNPSLQKILLFNSSATKQSLVTIQGKKFSETIGLMDKRKLVTSNEIVVEMHNSGDGDFSGQLCEVAIYSASAATIDQCLDDVNFPTHQFLTAINDQRCFYLALDKELESEFGRAAHECQRRKADISKITAGRLIYLNKLVEKSDIGDLTLWISNQSDVNSGTAQKSPWCGNACCPTITTTNFAKAVPAKCEEHNGYICERDLESCGWPDKNEIAQMKKVSRKIVGYSCPDGFQLSGNQQRFCKVGKWSGEAPICLGNGKIITPGAVKCDKNITDCQNLGRCSHSDSTALLLFSMILTIMSVNRFI